MKLKNGGQRAALAEWRTASKAALIVRRREIQRERKPRPLNAVAWLQNRHGKPEDK